MFCKNCGNQVEEGAFCPICGASLDSTPATYDCVPEGPTVNPGKSKGTLSLIMGIIGLVLGSVCSCACACLGGIAPLACAIVGLVMGILGLKASKEAGFSNTPALIGMILSIVAIVIILIFVLFNGVIGGINGFTQSVNPSYYNYY